MLSFLSDYTEGAHPEVLQHLMDRNLVTLPGYGFDEDTDEAKRKINAACGRDDLQIWFLTGGTQTNMFVISTTLRDCEGVISADTGHVCGHEAGAIEHSGHKVLTVPNEEGKITVENLDKFMKTFYADESNEHTVQPGMVYISHPTEYGTLYSKAELTALSEACRKYGLPLYMDGARMGYGLMSPKADLDLHDICELVDMFYIGGTKVGALCGEALIFTKQNMPRNFLALVKQRGGLLAKMRVVSQQFDALFTNDLYFRLSQHAIDMAMLLKEKVLSKGYKLHMNSYTNQQFVVVSRQKLEELRENVRFNVWEWLDDDTAAIRFATSWATTRESIEELEKLL
ncbi:MAG: low specificity L-threonine aldolase [Oscillospiraceae bacterium]|nr:low specificity L-threonine aldolase [Oscillospiraceae bacterium]